MKRKFMSVRFSCDGKDYYVNLARSKEGAALAKTCDITFPLGLSHKEMLLKVPTFRIKFDSGGAKICGTDAAGVARLAKEADSTEFNSKFVAWLVGEVVPIMRGDTDEPRTGHSEPPRPQPGSEVVTFDFEGRDVRTHTDQSGETWWAVADVILCLGLGNASMASTRIPDSEKAIISTDTQGGTQGLLYVNEHGLYRLIFTSRKEEAERFKDWVFKIVLPQIRKTGRFEMPGSQASHSADPIEASLQNALAIRREQVAMRQDIQLLQQIQTDAQAKIVEANARSAEAEARAKNAEARVAEADARAREAEALAIESQVQSSDALATAARSRSELAKVRHDVDHTFRLVTSEATSFCLVPWAHTKGVHLIPPQDGIEGKLVTAMCKAQNAPIGSLRTTRYPGGVNTYPEHILLEWLEAYKRRQAV